MTRKLAVRGGRRWLMVGACTLLTACSEEQPPGSPPEEPSAPQEALDGCSHVTPGPAGATGGAVAMSPAHALMRFFSAESHSVQVDEALTTALEPPMVDWEGVARAYAEALDGVRALETAS